MSTIDIRGVADALTHLRNGALLANPHGIVASTLREAHYAIEAVRVACGAWGIDALSHDAGHIVEELSAADEGTCGVFQATHLTDEEVAAAKIESNIGTPGDWLRLTAGRWQFLIECQTDSVDPGDSTRTSFFCRACGEVGRG